RANIPTALFRSDLEQSKAVLTDILGVAPPSYSFPFSSFGPDDTEICRMLFDVTATVERERLIECVADRALAPRFTWPGPARNGFRKRRWLLTGKIWGGFSWLSELFMTLANLGHVCPVLNSAMQ